MGVQGVSEYEREALILSSSLGASLASFWASRKKLAARRRRNSPAQNHRGGASRRPRPTEERKAFRTGGHIGPPLQRKAKSRTDL